MSKKLFLLFFTLPFLFFVLRGQNITTVAGNGLLGFSGDGGPATAADLDQPFAIAFDPTGNMYFSEVSHECIRMVNTSGIISAIAGNGSYGFSGDGGPATAAELTLCWSMVFDHAGNIYFSDTYSSRVRKIDTSGIITTIAGNGGSGHTGDGGQATAAQIGNPGPLAFDALGNLYIGDWGNSVIRKVNTNDTITTFAGTGAAGYLGDGGLATAAGFNGIYGMAFDASGNLFIADNPYRVREITNTNYVFTVAGQYSDGGCGGNNVPASSAKLSSVKDVAFDANGNLFVSDAGCNTVCMITVPLNIYGIAGTGVAGYNGDGIIATTAFLSSPQGVAIDASGSLYIADENNQRIRKVTNPQSLGINELQESGQSVTLYPNPNNGSFNLLIRNYELGITNYVEIYNMLGEKIYSQQLSTEHSTFNINTGNQPAGIYMYRIISSYNKQVASGKFIIE